MTSSNYLGAMTVEAAGVELTKYQQYLLNLREEVPAFGASSYLGQDGKFHEYGAGGQEENYLNLDDSVNYNKIFDRKNRINDLFSWIQKSKKNGKCTFSYTIDGNCLKVWNVPEIVHETH